jgi:AraC family transcriptional regulator of adaptative response / DNA-3-methyladenine glycosylase II
VIEDFELCYRAAESRDKRFDGRFVIAVRTTGVYCRPSCPAQTPRRQNVRFYPVAAAAQAAGFRACKRCRPQAAPGSRDWDIRADLAARALRLIADGVVDDDGVGGLAHRLAVSERHLHRLLVAEVGASPLALARTRRAQTARLLVESTDLPITDIAFTAGYSSVRQFNDSVREAFGCTPSELRTRSTKRIASSGAITLRLALHPPYDGDSWLAWLKSRAVASIEDISDTTYRRTIRLPRTTGIIELTPAADHMAMRLCIDSLADLAVAVSRCRVLSDLDADPETVAAVLTQDSFLAPAVEKLPGLRVPGHMDGFELACRAVIGQQISVAGARTMLGRLVEALGEPLSTPDGTLNRLFPTASAVAGSTLDGLGLTGARRRTLTALAGAVAGGSLDLNRGADRSETVQKLLELPGIGPWTASYIAIRALGDPDAFPASDLGLLRTSKELGGPETAAALEEYSLRWRPWRAYAAQYLWSI